MRAGSNKVLLEFLRHSRNRVFQQNRPKLAGQLPKISILSSIRSSLKLLPRSTVAVTRTPDCIDSFSTPTSRKYVCPSGPESVHFSVEPACCRRSAIGVDRQSSSAAEAISYACCRFTWEGDARYSANATATILIPEDILRFSTRTRLPVGNSHSSVSSWVPTNRNTSSDTLSATTGRHTSVPSSNILT